MAVPALTSRRALALLIAVLAVTSLLKARYCVYGPPLRNAVDTLLMPVARPLNTLTADVRGHADRPVLGDLQHLSDELRYEQALVISLQKRVRELELSNAALQGLSHRIGQDYVFREAHVIGRSSDPAARTLIIDKGARGGLRTGMVVVDGANLVGKLIEVGPSTSVLGLITSPDTLLEVVLTPPHLPKGGLPAARQHVTQLKVNKKHQLYADDLDRVVPVAAGDYARLDDERGPEGWPQAVQGMIVGQVVSVSPNPNQPLLQSVVVEPMRSLLHLETVTVVVPRSSSGEATTEGGTP